MNYIHLINWSWEEMPYREGFKGDYALLYFAIVDSINRNGWKSTAIEYDRLINKVKFGKRMYYEALRWLGQQELINYTPGKNDYATAMFDLHNNVKAVVQKCTSTTPQPTPLLHHNDTSTVPSTAPIIDKPLNNKLSSEPTGSFSSNSSLNEEKKKSKTVKKGKSPEEQKVSSRMLLHVESINEEYQRDVKEATAALSLSKKIHNIIAKARKANGNTEPVTDEDILTRFKSIIEKTYSLNNFYHFVTVAKLNSDYNAIVKKLKDMRSQSKPTNGIEVNFKSKSPD